MGAEGRFPSEVEGLVLDSLPTPPSREGCPSRSSLCVDFAELLLSPGDQVLCEKVVTTNPVA